MKIATNLSFNDDQTKFMSELHAILLEKLANLEAVRATSNDSSTSEIHKEKNYEDNQYLFPSHVLNNLNDDYDSMVSTYLEGLDKDAIPELESPCNLITIEEVDLHQNIAYNLEIIVQPIFVFIGLGFNTIAINILRR